MKTKNSQHSFFKNKISRNFGGSVLKSNPKSARPLSTKESIHLVLKSQYAVGNKSMLQTENVKAIESIVHRQAKSCGIKVYHYVNVGNHIHLVIKLSRHHLYAKFIRAVTGLIARHVMKKERGLTPTEPGKYLKKENFWMARPFSRIISWGKDFLTVTRYMRKNKTQAYWRKQFVAWGFEVVDPVKIQLMSTG